LTLGMAINFSRSASTGQQWNAWPRGGDYQGSLLSRCSDGPNDLSGHAHCSPDPAAAVPAAGFALCAAYGLRPSPPRRELGRAHFGSVRRSASAVKPRQRARVPLQCCRRPGHGRSWVRTLPHWPAGVAAPRSRTRRTFVLPELLGSTTSIRRHPPRRFYAAASGYPLSHACFAVAG